MEKIDNDGEIMRLEIGERAFFHIIYQEFYGPLVSYKDAMADRKARANENY